jgi:hypothetical protein
MKMKEFDPITFTKWINEKFEQERQGNIRYKVVDFAKMLENRSQTVSYWLLGNLTSRPSDEQCNKLISIYGFEAYEPLGLEPPFEESITSVLPSEEAKALLVALSEIRSSGINKGKDIASPDDIIKINAILEKHLGKYLVHGTEQ